MPHTIKVSQPNRPDDEEILTEFGSVTNGGTIELSDEQVAVWKINNPGRELPNAIDHSEAEKNRKDAMAYLRRPADEGESEASVEHRQREADEIELSLLQQAKLLDQTTTARVTTARQTPTTTTGAPGYSTMKATTEPKREGDN